MEEPGNAIRRGDSFSLAPVDPEEERKVTRADVAPITLAAIEQVARGFDLGQGVATVELRFADGLFEVAFLHRRVTLKQVAEFEPVFRETAESAEPLPSATKPASG